MGFVAFVGKTIPKKRVVSVVLFLVSLRVLVGPVEVSVGIGGAGTVEHSGTDPWALVVLVACTPLVGWSSWPYIWSS